MLACMIKRVVQPVASSSEILWLSKFLQATRITCESKNQKNHSPKAREAFKAFCMRYLPLSIESFHIHPCPSSIIFAFYSFYSVASYIHPADMRPVTGCWSHAINCTHYQLRMSLLSRNYFQVYFNARRALNKTVFAYGFRSVLGPQRDVSAYFNIPTRWGDGKLYRNFNLPTSLTSSHPFQCVAIFTVRFAFTL